jgi:hypothetical protein
MQITSLVGSCGSAWSAQLDAWTSEAHNGFLGITARYITELWELGSLCLDFIEMPGKFINFTQLIFVFLSCRSPPSPLSSSPFLYRKSYRQKFRVSLSKNPKPIEAC